MKLGRVLLVLTCLGALLSACGMKGPLYLPDTEEQEEAQEKEQP